MLEVDEIQGNVLAGFNKDFQTLLFYELVDDKKFKESLRPLLPKGFIATTREVLRFNRVFKLFHQNAGDPTGLVATWVNVAFSASGLAKLPHGWLAPGRLCRRFWDRSFSASTATLHEQ